MTKQTRNTVAYRDALSAPGRTMHDDSIQASKDNVGGSDEGYSFRAGYDSSMATRIGDEENSDRETERLRELHEGRHQSDGQHSVRESRRDKKRIAQAICSALPLASREREMVVTAVEKLNLDRFGNQKAIPKVTLGVVAVVVDEQHRADEGQTEELVRWTDEFRGLCDTHDISMSDRTTIKEIVRSELDAEPISLVSGPRSRDPALPGPTSYEERPDIFWDEFSAERWVSAARRWEDYSQDFRDAVPEEYRNLIDNLQRHAPWKDNAE